MAEEKNVRFKISKLEDLGYTFQKPEESIPTERINFSMETNIDFNPKSEKFAFILKPRFTTGKKNPRLIAELIFMVEFEFHELGTVLKKEDEETFTLPDQLVVTLFSISYSTMRGVFYEKSRGTMAERLILPVIDPAGILQKNESR
ncbi:hypothetical protein [Rhodohalobacter sp.]|uniref:hypothetical protein n=1 Tax=Rhodohalobacter sp. TaxID=1974210 RepID=UPI002ACE1D63|nr:hypothetical protein [Rhodohalobacter sp.]MDZ7757636.1 hypothetical protein [Rhodohalobacter sp.]